MFGKRVQSKQPGVGDRAAQRIAVPADVLGQRVDDEARVDGGFGLNSQGEVIVLSTT